MPYYLTTSSFRLKPVGGCPEEIIDLQHWSHLKLQWFHKNRRTKGKKQLAVWCSTLKGRFCISWRKMCCFEYFQSSKKHSQASKAAKPIKSKAWVSILGSNIPAIKDWASNIPFIDTQKLNNNFERLLLLFSFSRLQILRLGRFSDLCKPTVKGRTLS